MNTIGIETSGPVGCVGAAFPGGSAEIVFSEGTSHGRMLAKALHDLLEQLGWSMRDVGLIAVGVGPGSYTGTRIGTAFAKALSYAGSTPVVGVSSFEAMAALAPAHEGKVAPLLDARWDQVYSAVFAREGGVVRRLSPDMVGPLDEVLSAVPAGALFFGPGVAKFGIAAALRGPCAPPGPWDRPHADEIARAGAARFAACGLDEIDSIEPLYMRATQAEHKAGGGR